MPDTAATTTWYRYAYGNIEAIPVIKETTCMIQFHDRWGQVTRENKTHLHFRSKRDALEYAIKRAEGEIEHHNQQLTKTQKRLEGYHNQLAGERSESQ